MGFIGKNNMLIIPGHGSYLFLMEILATASLPFSKNMTMKSQCGNCTRCIDACPAGAIESPFSINASKCLSYLTVEFPGTLNSKTGEKLGNCFFGCDVCQEVCPFNEESSLRDFSLPTIDDILKMQAEDFEKKFGKTAFARAGIEKIKGNIKAIT
jgi:epoxyqueuosine reductase